MNEEFAIEPTAFENALQLKYFLEKFGFHRGRFIVGFPSRWIKQVHEHIQRFPDMEQTRARRVLELYAKKAIVPSGGLSYEPSLPWIDNAHHAKEVHDPFHNIIAANTNSFGYKTAHELVHDVDDSFFGSGNDIRILGTAENYSRIARRLLQMSHEVVLVDPYLRLERPLREKVIKKFIATAQEGKCRSFVCWVRHEEATKSIHTTKDYRVMLETKYKPSLASKSTLTVKLVNDANSTEKMHARLLLSILGGLRFDHGFEELIDDRRVDVSLVSRLAHHDHCCWYLDPNAKNDFVIVDTHTISG